MIVRTRDRKQLENQLERYRKQLEEAREELEELRSRIEDKEDEISNLEDDVLEGEEKLTAMLGEKQKVLARKKERPAAETDLVVFNLVKSEMKQLKY